MKTYMLEGFDLDEFKDITDFLDEVETNKLEAQIYVNSNGGSLWVLYCIRERLHELLKKDINIKLRGIFMASAAFDLFYTYKGCKTLEVDCDAIIHVSATEIASFQTKEGIKLRTDQLGRDRFEGNQFEYDFLSVKEDKKFNNGEDIYLDYKRLQSIFKS